MKLLKFLLLPLLCTFTHAATVEVEWDDDNPANSIERFGVYLKAGNGEFIRHGSALSREYSFNLVPGTYSVHVTAITAEGIQSEPSNAVTFIVPNAPTNLRIKVAIQVSDDLENWQNFAVAYLPEDKRMFARVVFQ